MVVVHDQSKAEKRPMNRPPFDVAHEEQTFEQRRNALERQASGNKSAYVLVARDEQGNVRVHASAGIKGYLDELQIASQYEQAIELATHESSSMASQRGTLISESNGIEIDSDGGDDDGGVTPVIPLPQFRIKGRRIHRPTRQRGRSMLPRDASRFSCAPYPLPEQTVREPIPSDTEDEPAPAVVRPAARKMLKSFRIDDTEEVTRFLASRLKRMQQLADKKIAKAWIKGICPKKQAKFPYQNQKRKKENGTETTRPAWWPTTGCRFIEPDHIRREERMELCLHLLRLRPSPEKLKAWNNHDVDPNPTHVTEGWTAFLNELAGPEIFDDLPKESPERTKMRLALMKQMYDIARMEEDHSIGARDGEDMFTYEEDEEDRKSMAPSKRIRRQSIVSLDELEERRSESVSCTRVKRARKDSSPAIPTDFEQRRFSDQKQDIEMLDIQTPQPTHHHTLPCSVALTDREAPKLQESLRQPGPLPVKQQARQTSDHDAQCQPVAVKYESMSHDSARQSNDQAHLWRSYEQNPGVWVDQNASTHFGQQFSDVGTYQPQSAMTTFPGKQSYEFPQYHAHAPNQVQVQQVHQVPQPEFHSLPTTPVFSPSGLVPMPLNSHPVYPPEQHLPPQPPYGTTMAPNQFFMPAHADHTVADFQPQMNLQQQHYLPENDGLAQRHITPMQYHGMSFTHPGAWNERPQHR
ncbi:hypothetical protein HII31_08767 [Pseudocercospora fuligena]|uniref:Subtelomeric hrmA-associated cluster protein AFUB-079030/YDR124W-like helical bundle domain-containing protein n=1 Tax=Pseudocercospora fuligena TaxID=685502 RepID=A0A8H6RDN8_9PEZI|nr:hypothetical protein HII31_08767 [Pseudocercospora fuligena]